MPVDEKPAARVVEPAEGMYEAAPLLDDAEALAMVRAIAKCNCRWSLRLNAERVEHFRQRVLERGDDPAETCILIVAVDDEHGGPLAEILRPGEDWQAIRDRGEVPFARAIFTGRRMLVEGIGLFDPEAAHKLATLPGLVVLVIDFGVAEVFPVNEGERVA
jgi:hypothetical protein